MVEPTDAEVDQFVATHPGGGTLDDIAAVLGVTRQRAMQLVNRAVAKVKSSLAERHLRLDDLTL